MSILNNFNRLSHLSVRHLRSRHQWIRSIHIGNNVKQQLSSHHHINIFIIRNLQYNMLSFVTNLRGKQLRLFRNFYHRLSKDFRLLKNEQQKTPDGFGKFFPKQKPQQSQQQQQPKTQQQSGAEKPKEIEFKFSFGTRPGGGGGGSGGSKPTDPNMWSLIGFAATFTLLMAYSFFKIHYREITWKEFINQYLQGGMVEKLEVVNKKWVRVKFMPGAPVATNTTLWFNIGSVETFERNLENIQLETNVEPANFVPVVYKNEMDRYDCFFVKFFHIILIIIKPNPVPMLFRFCPQL